MVPTSADPIIQGAHRDVVSFPLIRRRSFHSAATPAETKESAAKPRRAVPRNRPSLPRPDPASLTSPPPCRRASDSTKQSAMNQERTDERPKSRPATAGNDATDGQAEGQRRSPSQPCMRSATDGKSVVSVSADHRDWLPTGHAGTHLCRDKKIAPTMPAPTRSRCA